jgi:predicted ATPase
MEFWLHNIGPIRDARVDLAPVTVLIGPNGSGKTSLTNVVYALCLSHRHAVSTALNEFLNPFRREGRETSSEELLEEVVGTWLTSWQSRLAFELRRCCSPDLDDLRRARRGGQGAGPRLGVTGADWNVVFRLDGPEPEVDYDRTDLPAIDREALAGQPVQQALAVIASALVGGLPSNAVYFPAGRSGIVHSQAALGRLMSSAISGGWFQDATIGAIPGATADLMRRLAQLDPHAHAAEPNAIQLAAELETVLARGQLRLEVDGERRRMLFGPEGYGDREWEIQNMATSTAELAPLIFYLRHECRAGDTLIIDEPEAHLHPANQVELARLLAALTKAVSPVIVATHSEFLVSELSNVVLSGDQPTIAVYQFSFHDPEDRGYGVDVNTLEYDPAEGFEITQFSDVASQVFDESIRLYNARVDG